MAADAGHKGTRTLRKNIAGSPPTRGTTESADLVRLGVLGGSFNPVHWGHLYIARCARRLFGLSRIYFAVASFPPHKRREPMIPFTHRYAMVSLATSGLTGFVPSLVELEPPVSSYTIDTLAKLARDCSVAGAAIYFIAGADSLLDIAGWRHAEDLLLGYNFVFVTRPGVELEEPRAALPGLAATRLLDLRGSSVRQMRYHIRRTETQRPRLYLLDMRAPDISSSHIRGLIASRGPFRPLVPAQVREYIQKLNLYGG